MDWPYLRNVLTLHKNFLRKLFNQTEVIKTLNHASDSELDLLLKLLHLISHGHIPLNHKHRDVIVRSKREKKLLKFESREFLRKVLKSSHDEKLKLLKQFAKLFSVLLFHLFVKND